MSKRYFGTDGIRGRVGHSPITPDFVLRLGWAVGRVLARDRGSLVLVGKDTRISGYMFESALEAGLSAAGVDTKLLGPIPTPAIAYLTRTFRARAGIVISASHNPYYDNGIKFFSAEGTKLPDEVELAIEAELDHAMETVESARLGKATRVEDARGRYIEFCKSTVPSAVSLEGLRIVVDCANGATYQVSPSVLEELGAELIRVGTDPDGLNINDRCGSTQPQLLQARVLEEGADLGIALDGDGDRVIMVDHKGELVDGDELLFIIARSRQAAGKLGEAGVVGTVMSNLGLEHALAAHGIGFERTRVGDRYVLERLLEGGGILGGESSGHIICLDRTSTGDGTISALQVLTAMFFSGRSLNELKAGMTKYPQHMINVALTRPVDLKTSAPVQAAVDECEARLGDSGRILLRPSGTEPVVRVMVEGADAPLVEATARYLADAVTRAMSDGPEPSAAAG